MSSNDDFFAPPAFDPAAGLQNLRRSLRDLRQLSERGGNFELRGRAVADFAIEGQAIQARLARQPAHVPQWDTRLLKSSADVRQLVDEVKKRLARWSDE